MQQIHLFVSQSLKSFSTIGDAKGETNNTTDFIALTYTYIVIVLLSSK